MNNELLRETFEWIVDHPESHAQNWWARITDQDLMDSVRAADRISVRTGHLLVNKVAVEPSCGTAMCFAGNGVTIAHPGAMLLCDPNTGEASQVQLPDGTVEEISDLARADFGISFGRSTELFYGDHHKADIHRILVRWGVLPDQSYEEYLLERSLKKATTAAKSVVQDG